MTRKQKREAIYKAAELIHTGKEYYSCCSIEASLEWPTSGPFSPLAKEYAGFYDEEPGAWLLDVSTEEYLFEMKNIRVLLLLMFAEAGL